jgi:hypothetical protein
MPRFVLLYHDCPPNDVRASHWDLMLESGDVLRTWALERLPRSWQAARARTAIVYPNCPPLLLESTARAIQLSDHRRDYLGFEGPLSRDRGTVMRVAAGTYRSEYESPCEWRVMLTSEDLAESVQLSRSDGDNEHWSLLGTPY